jgi:Fe-S-cluster-containing dehydrogenase component
MTNISCKKWITATEKTHKLEQNDIFHQSIGQAPMDLMIKLFKVCDNVTVHRQCVHCAQTVCAQTVCAFLP